MTGVIILDQIQRQQQKKNKIIYEMFLYNVQKLVINEDF